MNPEHTRCKRLQSEIQDHLRNELLPFWAQRGTDHEYGGFLTYLDSEGNPTGETTKTLVCQTRMIYSAASAHRAGYGEGVFHEMARQGVDFLIENFWDDVHQGWFWACEQDGSPLNESKLTYGQSFAIYALAEYAMATGDSRGTEWALKTYDIVQSMAADNCHGGYYEFLEQDWSNKEPGPYGGDSKSFDIHMHLMEAFTNLYTATGMGIFRDKTIEIVNLILKCIIHPQHGTGMAQFGIDWTPRRQILFKDVWGADRDAGGDMGRPLNNTSYGHNVEFAWLLNHTVKALELDQNDFLPTLGKLFDHCIEYGIDWERGGVYCEGPHDGPARERNKEFWQQAECMVGMLDAYAMLGDSKYLDAYENVHRFVMDHVVNHAVGEWYPLFDENKNRLWDYMAHAWKINYHTVRAMLQCEKRFELM